MSAHEALRLSQELDPPGTWKDFGRRFRSESDCEQFLHAVRYPHGFRCPRCGDERGWPLRGRRLVECAAGHKTSLTAGTVMHGSRQSLSTWFQAAYLISTLTPGISAVQFQRQLGIRRYETAFDLLRKVRSVLVAPGRERLKGSVEVDETFVGGKDPDRDGRGGDKLLVAGAVEVVTFTTKLGVTRTRAGRVRLEVVADASGHSLGDFVKAQVEPGTIIHTDGWDGYRPLRRLGYDHRPTIQGKGREAIEVLPHLHRVFANLKRWITGTHHGRIAPANLQSYLNEYAFRFNRRFWRGPAFLRAVMLMSEPRHPNHKI